MSEISEIEINEVSEQTRFKELAAFEKLRINIAERMENLANSLEASLGNSQSIEDLRHHASELKAGFFRVLVMGDFNRGKSTLLNSLIGSEVLPINATPTTAVITVIRYGEEAKVRVIFADDNREQEMSFDDFKAKYQLDVADGKTQEEEALDRFSEVAQAIVEYPLELCRNSVELVDSPGLNDHPARTARVVQQLAQTDAVVFVFDAMHFYTQQERDYLDNLRRRHGLNNIFFVINAWDNIEKSSLEPEKDMAKIRERMHKELDGFVKDEGVEFEKRVFEASAMTALRARWLRKERQPRDPVDTEKLTESGIPAFEQELELFLRNQRGLVVMQRAERAANIVFDTALAEIRSRLNTLDVEVSELEARMERTKPYFEKLERVRSKILRSIDEVDKTQQRALYESFYKFFRDVDSHLEADAKAFMNEKEEGQEIYDPDNTLGNVRNIITDQEGFRRRLAQKYNRQSVRYFNRKVTEWQEMARAQLQIALEQLRDQFQGYAEEYNELVATIRAEFEGRPADEAFAFSGGLSEAAETLNRWFSTSELFSEDPSQMAAGTNIALMDVVRVLGAYGVTYAVVAGFAGLVGAILLPGLFIATPIVLAITAIAGTVVGSKVWADQITAKYVEQTRQKLLPSIAEREPQLKGEINRVFGKFSSQVGLAIGKEIEGLRQSLQKTIERKRTLEGQATAERARLETAQKEAADILADLRTEIKNFFA